MFKLTQEAVVRLCRVGLCSKNDPFVGVGKRLKFVSDCEEVCRPLRKLQSCSCERHAGFNEVNWTATGFYNEQLARFAQQCFHESTDPCARMKKPQRLSERREKQA